MSSPTNRYQFVFRHLTPINEIPNNNTHHKPFGLQRNESLGLFQNQPITLLFSQTPCLSKSVSTPNLQAPGSILSQSQFNSGLSENLIFHNKNSAYHKSSLNQDSKKVQNMHQQKSLSKNSMSSNQKKSYQYYFKKTGTSDGRQSWPRITPEIKTQSYIKYDKYIKVTSSIHSSSSASKDVAGQRVDTSVGLQKNRAYQATNYGSSKLLLQRQPSIENKTEKPMYNFVTSAMSSAANKHPAKTNLYTGRVMVTEHNEFPVNNRVQQPLSQSQMESKPTQSSKIPQKIELTPKSKQFQQFFNLTMGETALGVEKQKTNGHKSYNINNIKNLSEISYLQEIQKIKTKLKFSQVQEETILKVEDGIKSVNKEETVGEVGVIEENSLCQQCSRLKKQLQKSKGDNEQIQKKRQANMDQIFRQQKTIRELQQNQNKLKTNLQAKHNQIISLQKHLQTIAQSQSSAKAQYTELQQSFTQRLEAQLKQIRTTYQQKQQQYTQKISTYVQMISRQNKRIEEMEELNRKNQREVSLEYQRRIVEVSKQKQEELDRIVKQMTDKEASRIQTLNKQHALHIQTLTHHHQQYTSTLLNKLHQLQQTLSHIPTLNQTIQKLQSQILHQKSAIYSSSKQLNAYKLYVQQLEKDVELLKDQKEEIQKVNMKLGQDKEVDMREISRLNEEKHGLDVRFSTQAQRTVQLNVMLNNAKQQLQESRQSLSQLSKQNKQLQTDLTSLQNQKTYLTCLNQLFKHHIDPQQYQTLSTKVLSLLETNTPVSQIITRVTQPNNNHSAITPQWEKASISPSTSSLPTKSQKNHKQKETQSQSNQLKVTVQKLTQVEANYKKTIGELQESKDLLIMREKMISALEENIKTTDNLTLKLSQENQSLITKLSTLQETIVCNKSQSQQLTSTLKETQIKLKLKNNQLNETIVEIDCLKQLLQQKQQLITQLNQKLITLHYQLQQQTQPSSQSTQFTQFTQSTLNIQTKQPTSIPYSPRQTLQPLMQQLQAKDQQINQLSTQLQESFEIIKVLKSQLQQREHQFAIYQQEHQIKRLDHNRNWERERGSGSGSETEEVDREVDYDQNNQGVWRDDRHKEKTILTKQYQAKIQEYYNQVLQIFGLQEVSFQLINHNRIQPITPHQIKSHNKMPSRSNSLNSQSSMQSQKRYDQIHIQPNQEHINSSQSTQLQQLPNPPQHPPIQHLLSYLSLTQQQVLRIINQWIRKLQRQSLSLHQGKQKIHFMQRHNKDLQHANSMLEREKLQICDKYETFIAKLESENSLLEQKAQVITLKLAQMQIYVKELQEVILQTNNQCLKNGLYALQIIKQHQVDSLNLKPHFNPDEVSVKQKDKQLKESQLLMEQGKSVTHHTCLQYLNRKLMQECAQVEGTQSYWDEFYQRHSKKGGRLDLSLVVGERTENDHKVIEQLRQPLKCKNTQQRPRQPNNSANLVKNQQNTTESTITTG